MATEKQTKAFQKVVLEYKPVSVAMKEVGYSKSMANNPQYLTQSDGWKELVEKYIPDDLLAQKHRDLLQATDKDGYTDYGSVKAGIDMGYKLKGKYAPDRSVSVNIDIATPEALELANQLLERQSATTSIAGDGTVSESLG